ncbi:MAG TPA: helix-turn-helix transcriptional regulator [Firmicutes bacterium]|nr:helix-turn-helix transcriptional regulator [Bacillota bacterium]
MVDQTALGNKILERRKAKGLTQEQLGHELGVSAQAVSKWELGESLPDAAILPSLCKVLEVSADTLLGIDGGVGIDTLSRELAKRIHQQKDPGEALVQALKYLQTGGTQYSERTPYTGTNIAYNFNNGALTGVDLWSSVGIVCFMRGEVLRPGAISTERLHSIRTLISPEHWRIAELLLTGPKKEKELLEANAATGDPESLRNAIETMTEAGLVERDQEGYKLGTFGLLFAAVIRALCADKLTRVGMGCLYSRQFPPPAE